MRRRFRLGRSANAAVRSGFSVKPEMVRDELAEHTQTTPVIFRRRYTANARCGTESSGVFWGRRSFLLLADMSEVFSAGHDSYRSPGNASKSASIPYTYGNDVLPAGCDEVGW